MERKVLIIDDNDDDILMTKSILSKIGLGITIEVASSGEEGLAHVRKGTVLPTLILLDVKMPGMSGIDVLRKIRSDKRLASIPVVIVTHSILESDFVASYKSGASSILLKTADIDKFKRYMLNLFENFMAK